LRLVPPVRTTLLLTLPILLLVACSGSGSSSSGGQATGTTSAIGTTSATSSRTASTQASPSGTPTTQPPAAAAAQITRAWIRFFAGSTPATQKIALLQNGSAFAAIISAQANTPVARQTSAVVLQVHVLSANTASVA
jgi:hypothetical protein